MDNGKIGHYFVDEAGDPSLFGKYGKVLVGSEGCSKFFILVLLHIEDPLTLSQELTVLRYKILDDPYFAGVPSIQLSNKKTAIGFHAKDDLPEVRKEVFSLLLSRKDLRFYAIIRDKTKLLEFVRKQNIVSPGYKYNPNDLYDYLVRRLFKDHLHLHDGYEVHFARRGASDRTNSLQKALETAQIRFLNKYNKDIKRPNIKVIPEFSKDNPALQATDYYLWALQRLYDHTEDRYIKLLWSSVKLVIDIDDCHLAKYGRYYDEKHPLTLDEFLKRD